MVVVVLTDDDRDRASLFVVWRVAKAILRAMGHTKDKHGRWPPLAEREVWSKIDAGFVRGLLRPVDSSTHAERARGDIADAVTPLAEWEAWGKATGLYEFEFERSPADAEEQEVGAGGMGQVTKHQLKSRTYPLDAVIEQATNSALSPKDTSSVYAEMVKLAELKDKPAPLIGFCTEGIQYQGKKYQETGEPDIFTKKNLRDRMTRRAKTR